jgi:hypothetical protein
MAEHEQLRQTVSQKLVYLLTQGGWEGLHLDLKRDLDSTNRSIAKLLKHILAFANTARKDVALIIFGIAEDKKRRKFEHVGATGFPDADMLYNIVKSRTNLSPNDIVIDDQFYLQGKHTPYIAIHQVYDGPYKLTNEIKGQSRIINKNTYYVRYNRSSEPATERDKLKMEKDWDSWAIDCRYIANLNDLEKRIRADFAKILEIQKTPDYVRFAFDARLQHPLAHFTKPILVHAYSGYVTLTVKQLENILRDTFPNADKWLIGAAFDTDVLKKAGDEHIACVELEKLFFQNDSYARYCEAYLNLWNEQTVYFNLA